MSAILTTKGLTVRYGGNVALQPLDLEIPEASLITVVGSNGAGKSTLLSAIAGWSRGKAIQTGDVFLREEDISKRSTVYRANAGVTLVPESHSIFYSLTVEENLTLHRESHREGQRSLEEIYELLPRLAERKKQQAGSLSGGQRQMLAIGRALIANPTLLMLDEPSIGLAPQVIVEILQFVRNLVDSGMSVLLSEQNVTAVLGVSDELILLERGSVLTRGTPDELKDDPRLIDAYLGTES
ncbi:ABC transporter ATP-binding protein [Microcella sp.]|uniref:ABC transporter ATP-binding protein n=1 Tax=Microcella sp. TaxID=1913979 RepID=UPI00256D84E7|nr:ABC transporter ATP-binding protein [Microcella sp.]MBX9472375.1 ABC transporter ATP-binding protein [Microcella sp.]